ncbi:MAG: DJ-1/PfpI family protein [Candidatus Hydrogenedentes bacterium]|nr:DJ-1/PfpI family protein [Candidatus Hydrogenedentota bacterium]
MAFQYGYRRAIAAIVLALFSAAGYQAAAQDRSGTEQNSAKTLGVVLYPGFEVLDVFGPVEMFISVGAERLRVIMIAEEAGPVASGTMSDKAGNWSGPKVVADYGFADAPHVDILMIPGGAGTIKQLTNTACHEFLKQRSDAAELVLSVCSGSAILAKAGILDGHKATCNKEFYSLLISNGPKVEWQSKARWVEDGKFVTSSGVSAGIDMALAVIARVYGEQTADGIAKGTEYTWSKDPANDPFAK